MSQWGNVVPTSLGSIRGETYKEARVYPRRERTKMSMTQKFFSWLKNRIDNAEYESSEKQTAVQDVPQLEADGLRFQLFMADGGAVLQSFQYDKTTHQNKNKLCILTGDNIAEQVGNFVVMEMMRTR